MAFKENRKEKKHSQHPFSFPFGPTRRPAQQTAQAARAPDPPFSPCLADARTPLQQAPPLFPPADTRGPPGSVVIFFSVTGTDSPPTPNPIPWIRDSLAFLRQPNPYKALVSSTARLFFVSAAKACPSSIPRDVLDLGVAVLALLRSERSLLLPNANRTPR